MKKELWITTSSGWDPLRRDLYDEITKPIFDDDITSKIVAETKKTRTDYDKFYIATKNITIKKVIYADPATIIYWSDGVKTVVKCQEGDTYSKEIGFVMCYLKRLLGNGNQFNKQIKKWVTEDKK